MGTNAIVSVMRPRSCSASAPRKDRTTTAATVLPFGAAVQATALYSSRRASRDSAATAAARRPPPFATPRCTRFSGETRAARGVLTG